jgi:hypothetical protein
MVADGEARTLWLEPVLPECRIVAHNPYPHTHYVHGGLQVDEFPDFGAAVLSALKTARGTRKGWKVRLDPVPGEDYAAASARLAAALEAAEVLDVLGTATAAGGSEP